jgi:hypothetical protein
MKNSIPVILAAFAILASQCVAQEAQVQKMTETPSGTKLASIVIKEDVNKYEKMEKKQLQDELRKLLKELPIAEKALTQAKIRKDEATKVVDVASSDEKSDAFFLMMEAQVKCSKAELSLNRMRSDFSAAQHAYLNLLLAEQK